MLDQPQLNIDFSAITGLFDEAQGQGRDFLFEDETYRLLADSGAETPPRTQLLKKGSRPSDEELAIMPGDRAVRTLATYIEGRLHALRTAEPEVWKRARRAVISYLC